MLTTVFALIDPTFQAGARLRSGSCFSPQSHQPAAPGKSRLPQRILSLALMTTNFGEIR